MDTFFDKSGGESSDFVFDPHGDQNDVYYEGDTAIKYDSIFFRQLVLGNINGDLESTPEQYNQLDKENKYELNSLGFRGPECHNVDLVFAGCSYTFGLGIPEDGIYGALVANNYGHSYNNISLPGKSVEWIVDSLFSYFRNYGHPKKLICLFPNFSRQQIVSDKQSFLAQSHGSPLQLWITDVHHTDVGFDRKNKPKYSKTPHDPLDILPAEMAIYSSFRHIEMLEQYCAAAGIDFLWSTWDAGNLRLLNKLQNEHGLYRYFVPFDMGSWQTEEETDIFGRVVKCKDFFTRYDSVNSEKVKVFCHKDYETKFSTSFYRGTDVEHGPQDAHKGVHFHAHVAEMFVKEFDRRSVS